MRVVLFDVDGVLLDSAARHRDVWSTWSARHGLDLDVVWAQTHGRRPRETFAAVAAHLDPDIEDAALAELLLASEVQSPTFPGTSELLRALPAAQWAIVTSGIRATQAGNFAAAGLPLPEVIVTGEDVQHGKPDPEGYLRAAELLDANPDECLVVEDAPAGVAAGKAAGMIVLGIESTHRTSDLSGADRSAPSLSVAAADILRWVASGW
jgi:sugar-phosphatase